MLEPVMIGQLEGRKAQVQPNSFSPTEKVFGRSNMDTRTSGKSGFTLLEIMIVVSISSLVAAIAIPNFVCARSVSQQTTCINNLRQIGSAVAQWALETKAAGTSTVQFSDMQPYLRGSTICPSGGTSFSDSYDISNVQTPPACKKASAGPNAHCLPTDISR
jgi:prepilin-type N-terminal cleavage/methylation domain-containing protein